MTGIPHPRLGNLLHPLLQVGLIRAAPTIVVARPLRPEHSTGPPDADLSCAPDGVDELPAPVMVAGWLDDHPRKGLPAPWLTQRWKDEDWALAQICSRSDRLSIDQVRAIRAPAADHPAEIIAARIGAQSAEQVRRAINGKTYGRVAGVSAERD